MHRFNKYISIFLCTFIIIFYVVNSCITSFASDAFNKIYDGYDFSETISNHGSFVFVDKAGNNHTVARVGNSWICLFGNRQVFYDDTELNYFLSYYAYQGYSNIFNTFGAYLSNKLGSLTKGEYTMLENALSSDVNSIANSIIYDEDTQTITFDSASVDSLREEIKKYYYDSIGLMSVKPTDTIHNPGYLIELNRPLYDYEEDYISDFNSLNQYDYSVGTRYGDYTTRLICGFDKNSYSYAYIGSLGNNRAIYFLDKDMNSINDSVINVYTAQSYGVANERIDLNYTFKTFNLDGNVFGLHLFSQNDSGNYVESTFYNGFTYDRSVFFSKNGKPFTYFSSYEKLFNFLNGSQDAYLSSRIDKAGEDISFSINDMNENLGSKMDELIDSINSNKSGMSQDELQNAIDKGLEDLNKNAEEIKDNTEETNNKLDNLIDLISEQNQTLLEILGVTEYIAYQISVDDSDNNNFDTLKMLFNTMIDGVYNAIMYGENSVDTSDDDNVSTASVASAVTYSNSGSSGGSIDFDYHNGLFGKFPFSVPYQLYDWLQILQATPKAPEFSYNYGFLIGKKDDESCVISFDLSQYNSWRDVISSFLKLSMTLTVAIGTYKRFKGEML